MSQTKTRGGDMVTLTQQQAQELCDSIEIEQLLENEEERELLEENNPSLLAAYLALHLIAKGQ